MTTMRQHIEDLDLTKWAQLTRRAAQESLATAARLNLPSRPETVALAGMTEDELIERRRRNGQAKRRPSPVMQLVEAEHRSRQAQEHARNARQRQLDAEAAATLARAEAKEGARVAEAAREQLRAVEAAAAERDRRRAQERAADQTETQQIRTEAEQIRADAAAEVAAAHERARAAEERAQQRAGERTTERANAESTIQELHSQIAQIRAEAEAEIAAAREHASAAEERAQQRLTERAEERSAAAEAQAQLHNEIEQLRADTAAVTAAVRGQAAAEVAAAKRDAQTEIDEAQRRANAEIAQVRAAAPNLGLLTIPIAPVEVRDQVGSIETLLDALYQIDFLLEAARITPSALPDVGHLRTLTWTVQERSRGLAAELSELPGRFANQDEIRMSAAYANAAGVTYNGLLHRIEGALHHLQSPDNAAAADALDAVSAMLADPSIQALRTLGG